MHTTKRAKKFMKQKGVDYAKRFFMALFVVSMVASSMPLQAIAETLSDEAAVEAAEQTVEPVSVETTDGDTSEGEGTDTPSVDTTTGIANVATAEEFVAAINNKSVTTINVTTDIDITWPNGQNESKQLDASGKTIDLGNNTVSASNYTAVFVGDDFTIQNGKLDSKGGSYALFIGMPDTGKATANNVTVKNVTTTGGINISWATNVVLQDVDSTSVGKWSYAVWCNEGGQVTIESGNFASPSSAALVGLYRAADESSMTIKGGTFTVTEGKLLYFVSGEDYGKPSIIGGVFNIDPSAYLANGYKAVENDGEDAGTWTVQSILPLVQVTNGETVTVYETFADAFANLEDGGTIDLLGNITENVRMVGTKVNADETVEFENLSEFTINLNGYSITCPSTSNYAMFLKASNVDVTINGKGADGTNGSIVNNSGARGFGFVTNGNQRGCDIVFNDVDIIAVDADGNGLTHAMYLPAGGDIEMNGCNVVSGNVGIETRAENVVLNNTNVSGGTGETTVDSNLSGTTTNNAAISVSQHATKLDINFEIKGDSKIESSTALVTAYPETDPKYDSIAVTVFGGELSGDLNIHERSTLLVEGGSFTQDPTVYAASGSVINKMEDGTYVVNQATVEGGDITVGEADVEDGASEVMVAVDKKTVQAAKDAGSLKLATPSSSMTLDSKALEQILKAAGDDSVVTIDYATAEKVEASVAKDIDATYKKTALLTLEATVYVDGVEQPLYGSSITLSMPHEYFAAKPTAVYYVNNNGDIEGIYKVTDDGSSYAFTTTHLSTYVYAGERAERVTMYRLYNPNSGEHFYTAELEERDALIAAGWKGEGIGWYAPSASSTPVYRLYSGTDHHYTTSATERDYLVSVGWTDEGIGWYSDDAEGVALYRQYNPFVDPSAKTNNSGSHNYTTSTTERDNLVSLGWIDEDVAWYGML